MLHEAEVKLHRTHKMLAQRPPANAPGMNGLGSGAGMNGLGSGAGMNGLGSGAGNASDSGPVVGPVLGTGSGVFERDNQAQQAAFQ